MPHKVFVTGATGYLGSAIAARIVRAGHEVHGLTRNPERADSLAVMGIKPVVGDLKTFDSYLGILKNFDVAVHVAFDPADIVGTDLRALEAFRTAAQDGRLRRLLYTSGMWVHGDTRGAVVNEQSPLEPLEIVRWRAAHEEIALDLADDEVQVVVFRPPLVYGERRGVLGGMFAEARTAKTVTVPGDGRQPWGLVHRDDVADAYRLGLEYANGGERYIIGDESHHTALEIGEAIARVAGAELRLMPAEQVRERMGPFGDALLAGQIATSAKARRELGWVPRHSSFVNEVDGLYQEWGKQVTPVG
jgi:nucleoside-diphosphate-sugar epimerase